MFGNKMNKIAKYSGKGDADKLVGFLNDRKEDVRLAAIDALGKCSGDTPFNAVVPLIHNPDATVRIHAAGALCSLKQPRARTYLEHQRALEKDAGVMKAIDDALAHIQDDQN